MSPVPWQNGDAVVLRGMFRGRPAYAQAVLVVADAPEKTALAVLPGAECAAPPGYIHGRHGESGRWDRWEEMIGQTWVLEKYAWRANRFLILLEPGQYYAICLVWDGAGGGFNGYYINFQLPVTRSRCGFDTLDLDLDLVIHPDQTWQWKDEEEYRSARTRGAFQPAWVRSLEQARLEALARFERRQPPFDGSWCAWLPHPTWRPPQLPAGWDDPSPY